MLEWALAAGMIYILKDYIPTPKVRKFSPKVAKKLKGLTVIIGYKRWKKFYLSLQQAPHLLVAGQTGGGKSVWLRVCILSLLLMKPRPKIYLIDLKNGAEFGLFEPWADKVAKNTREAVSLLKEIQKEMDRRYQLFYKAGVTNFSAFLGKDNYLPLIVIAFDEYGRFTTQGIKEAEILGDMWIGEKKYREAGQMITVLLGQQARACGIHMIVSTQYPISELVSGALKINLPTRLIFKVGSKKQSEVCLDNDKASSLTGEPGKAIFKYRNIEEEIKTPWLSEERLKEYLEQIPKLERPKKIKKVI